MNQERECGCKGRRTCLWCEREFNLKPDFILHDEMRQKGYVYCPDCNLAWPGWDIHLVSNHPHHEGVSIPYNGVLILKDFLNEEQASYLLKGIDEDRWDASQSGRRKQNYGPKCNFKKRKIVKGDFQGFPQYSTFVHKLLSDVPILKDFFVIEQCSLEYDASKGASIDPHIDDCWIWGERIVTVNVLGDSVLTMIPFKGENFKYNLSQVPQSARDPLPLENIVVRIPMPVRSLIVLYGSARYDWEHCVLREDTTERRVCLAYREFTQPYLPGGKHQDIGDTILNISKESSGFIIK